MSAVLRAYGANFNVDEFLDDCTLTACAIMRRGEPVFPNSQPNGRRNEQLGVHLCASDADFDEFPRQVEEATVYLRKAFEQIQRLCTFPGVENVTLDFGGERRDVAVQYDRLTPELVRVAGSLGLGIDISQYPASEATDDTKPVAAPERE